MVAHGALSPATPSPEAPSGRWTVEEVHPVELRDELVDFFWAQRHWPYATREDYVRAWDWRQASLGDEPTRVWVARAGGSASYGEIVGHIAVYPRHFRFRGRELRVAVPGNFVVRADHRNTLIGPRLAAGLRRLVMDREFDAVLAYANPAAHLMFTRLGFRVLGQFHEFLDVRRSASRLRRFARAAAIAAPVVDAVLAARRWWLDRRVPDVSGWQARILDAVQVQQLDRTHWSLSEDRIAHTMTSAYLAGRFLSSPFSTYRIIGVFDRTGAVQALVAVNARRRLRVCDCAMNPLAIDAPKAIAVALRALPDCQAVLVQVPPESRTARELVRAGYIARGPRDAVAAGTWWSGYWRDDHPLAKDLADPTRWSLLLGSTQY